MELNWRGGGERGRWSRENCQFLRGFKGRRGDGNKFGEGRRGDISCSESDGDASGCVSSGFAQLFYLT